MSEGSDARLGLAEYLTELQAELSAARSRAEKDDLKFNVDEVTLEVDIACTLARSAGALAGVKPEFWVLGPNANDAKNGVGSAHRSLQRLTVRLAPTPEAVDADESEEVAGRSMLPPAPLPDFE